MKLKHSLIVLSILMLLPITGFSYFLSINQPAQTSFPTTVTANQNSVVSISWLLNLDTINSVCPCTITSSTGQFSTGTLPTAALPTRNDALTPSSPVTITEILNVPAAVSLQAFLSGQGLTYTRSFTSFEGATAGSTVSLTVNISVNPPPPPILSISPAISSYLVGSNLNINANWNFSQIINGTGTISSANAIFTSAQNSNSIIASAGAVLNVTPGAFSVAEQFSIPASVITAAQQNNLTAIYYSRDFVAGVTGTTNRAFIRINLIQPNPQAVLTLQRVALRFNDNSVSKIVKSGSRISALVEIKYQGSGLLNAMWEIADPTSTQGSQSLDRFIFIAKRSVRQYLGAGGRVYIQSPMLPTNFPGNYVLRLRIIQPSSLSFTQPVLRYSVNQDSIGAGKLPQLRITAPGDKTKLQKNGLFHWAAVPGAKAYQLEMYLWDMNARLASELSQRGYDETTVKDKTPSTGTLVPGNKTSLSLSALSRGQLRHGESYLWRINAIGKNGQVISRSALRQIKVP